MQWNAKPSKWPNRKEWSALLQLSAKVVDEYWKTQEVGYAVKRSN